MAIERTRIAEARRVCLLQVQRLERRHRVLELVSLAGVLGLAVRALLGLAAPGLAPGRAGAHLTIALGVGFAVSLAGLLLARRWRAQLAEERARLFWLELLLDAADHETAPALAISPYRDGADGPPVVVVRRPELFDALPQPERPRAPRGGPVWRPLVASLAMVALGVFVLGSLRDVEPDAAARSHRWTFTEPATDFAELGFVAPIPGGGAWVLTDHAPATGGRALVNHAGDADGRPALAVAQAARSRDVRASTRCKVGETGSACGLVFRFHDEANHYVAHIDSTTDRIALEVVLGGMPRTLASVPAPSDHGVWQELAVEARSSRLAVIWNGRKVIEAHDATLAVPGGVGLWAPSATVAIFDELAIEPLSSSAHPVELLPFLLGRG